MINNANIAALRHLVEGAITRNLPLILTFVDFPKAFDSVIRIMLLAIFRHYGIPQKIVDAIASLYINTMARVLVNGKLSDMFNISTGVLQGDILAPYLFIIVIDFVMSRAAQNFGIEISRRRSTRHPAKYLGDLDYADDIALLESDPSAACRQLEELRREALAVGLEINVEKTECMLFNLP